MAKKAAPLSTKIAEALKSAKAAANGGHVFKLGTLSRTEQTTLKKGNWVFPIYSGWYALLNPSSTKTGDTIAFFSNYWEFVQKYLAEHYGQDYVLSPANSLLLQTEDNSIPKQLHVNIGKTTYNKISLPFDTSIFISKGSEDEIRRAQTRDNLRLLSLEASLTAMPPNFFRQSSPSLEAAILSVRNISLLSHILIEKREQTTAGRITSCFKKIGRDKDAAMIEKAFEAAGLQLKTEDLEPKFGSLRLVRKSAIGARLSHMWLRHSQELERLLENWPEAAGNPDKFYKRPFGDVDQKMDSLYSNDAYNSLSIEGYSVTDELITRIGRGEFDPHNNPNDRSQVDAMAALGYHDAFLLVKESLRKIHTGGDLNQILFEDLSEWRVALFKHSAQAFGRSTASLIGYRNSSIYIRDSHHVPPSQHSLMDAMESFQELYSSEHHPFKRAVLSHHVQVYVHPYLDGNGRTARFLLNVSLVSGGLPWAVIPKEKKLEYFAALEAAHTGQGIEKFAEFIYRLMTLQTAKF
ncbi:MAG TPA: Fic family protein [Oligoflexus sp.]|uniref:Fic family protein n=1 Tax=Oligoflexus sp. TaxID=1971216 RepID=UPI002D57955A|nr:Fic family protein [Oligoflexus sp.]HYX32024.1 Fic family protein [Oligoflexus sp.]